MSLIKIGHFADIQINCYGKWISRAFEYDHDLNLAADDVIASGIELVVIVGDSFERTSASNEESAIFTKFIQKLTNAGIFVLIVPGNHDMKLHNLDAYVDIHGKQQYEKDPIHAAIAGIKNVLYVEDSSFVELGGMVFAIWSHKTKYRNKEQYNPWSLPEAAQYAPEVTGKFTVDLFHDPIKNCVDFDGRVVRGHNEHRIDIKEFNGHLAMMGDIHKPQVHTIRVDDDGTKSYAIYPGSTVIRNFKEGDYYDNAKVLAAGNNEHNWMQYEVDTSAGSKGLIGANKKPVKQMCKWHTIHVYEHDIESILSLELDAAEFHRIRVVRHFAKHTSTEVFDKFIAMLQTKYKLLTLRIDDAFKLHVAEDSNEAPIDVSFDWILERGKQWVDKAYEHVDNDETKSRLVYKTMKHIESVVKTAESRIGTESVTINKITAYNFMSIDKITLDLNDYKGFNIITAANGVGKTTLMRALKWCKFDTVDYRQPANQKKLNAIQVFNDKYPDRDDCFVELELNDSAGNIYTIKRAQYKQWTADATKSVTNWKNEIIKVHYELTIHKNGVVQTEEEAQQLLSSMFHDYHMYAQLYCLDGSTLEYIVHQKADQIPAWLMSRLGINIVDTYNMMKKGIKTDVYANIDPVKYSEQELQQQIVDYTAAIETKQTSISTNNLSVSTFTNDLKQCNDELYALKNANAPVAPTMPSLIAESMEYTALAQKTVQALALANRTDVITSIPDIDIELVSLTNNINNANEINATADKNIQDSTVKLKALNDNLPTLSKQLNNKLAEIDAVTTQLHTELTDIRKQKDEHAETVKNAMNTVTTTNDAITKLTNEHNLNKLQITTAHENAVRDNITTQVDKLNASKHVIQTSITEKNTVVQNLQNEIDSLTADIAKLESSGSCSECGRVYDNIKEIEQHIEQHKASIVVKQAKIQEINTELEITFNPAILQLNTKITELNNADIVTIAKTTSSKELSDADNIFETKLTELRTNEEYVRCNTLITDSEAKTADLTVKETAKQQEINAQQDKVTEANSKYDADVRNFNNLITTIEQDIERFKATKIYPETLDKNKTRLTELTTHAKTIVDYVNASRAYVIKLNEFNGQNAPKIDALNLRISELTNSIDTANAENLELTKGIGNDEAQLANCKLMQQQLHLKSEADFIISNIDKAMTYNKGSLAMELFDKISEKLNSELEQLCQGLLFNVFFDKDTAALMMEDKIGACSVRPAFFASGMQETFIALNLIALLWKHKVQQKQNIAFIDEISGKLHDGKNVAGDIEVINYRKMLAKQLIHICELTGESIFLIDQTLDHDYADNIIQLKLNAQAATVLA